MWFQNFKKIFGRVNSEFGFGRVGCGAGWGCGGGWPLGGGRSGGGK